MSLFNENPKLILENINELLIIGALDRKHAFHTPIFSNLDQKNTVKSRIVVLRKFDPNSLKLNFHTDIRSPKIKELKQNNNSYFVFYDAKIKIQLRIKTNSIINYQNDLTKKTWQKTSLSSRKCYLTKKNPSAKANFPEDGIPKKFTGTDPSKLESEKGYNNFTIIENIIINIDWLHLASSGHRRLNISFNKEEPKFDWLIP